MRKLLDFRRAPAAAGPIATALFALVRLHLGGPGSALPRAAPDRSDPHPHSFGQGRQSWACAVSQPRKNLDFLSAESFEMNQARRKKKPGANPSYALPGDPPCPEPAPRLDRDSSTSERSLDFHRFGPSADGPAARHRRPPALPDR
jgi:hypothetical protein